MERYVFPVQTLTIWYHRNVNLSASKSVQKTKDNKTHLKDVFKLVKEKCMRNIFTDISVLTNASSYAIFNARFSPLWTDSDIFMWILEPNDTLTSSQPYGNNAAIPCVL